VDFQFGIHITKEGNRYPTNSRYNRQARQLGRSGPLNMEVENVGATEKASCSESCLLLTTVADLPLYACALYRQTEQGRHFRWRGWMLRPRVIRSPTKPKWERSRVRAPLCAACSFCFLFCRFLFFFIFVCLRQAAFVNFINS